MIHSQDGDPRPTRFKKDQLKMVGIGSTITARELHAFTLDTTSNDLHGGSLADFSGLWRGDKKLIKTSGMGRRYMMEPSA